MSKNAKEAILEAARRTAQAHGYGGLNFRDIGAEVGIKAATTLPPLPQQSQPRCSGSKTLLGRHGGES